MDRNSIIGLVIIAGIILVYSLFFGPSPEEREKLQRQQDSIAAVEQQLVEVEKGATISSANGTAFTPDTTAALVAEGDSATQAAMNTRLNEKFGLLASASEANSASAQIETDEFIVTISAMGGKVSRVELKKYKTYQGTPLVIFDETSNRFGVEFEYPGKGVFNTNDFAFQGDYTDVKLSGDETKTLVYRMVTANPDKYLEYRYTFTGNKYDVGFEMKLQNLSDVVSITSKPTLQWEMTGLASEKLITDERNICTVFYKEQGRNRDYLSETSDDDDIMDDSKLEWVAFKQKFFSAILMTDLPFETGSSMQVNEAANDIYTKRFAAKLMLPVASAESALVPMRFFFGPNHYQTLKAYDRDLDEIINLGWGIFGWVNKWAVIPIFNFLDGFGWGYGLIILLLTVIIKVVLFPLMYKNYMSSAKMRVLKPDIDEMNERMKDADAMKKQQATLELYRKTGVNPMSGCIPMLIQMPILYAMFRFFPSSIELRHESFLWADDLSSYDSIVNLPFAIPMYGAHISLFTVLMAASTFLYTWMNSSQMPTTNQPGMPNMKVIMYIFPFMMLFFFNSFSSGLSYYYLLANMLSIGQMVVIKQFFVDEDKIRAKISENKNKKDAGKKSRFQKKLEELSKQQTNKK
jgi:YidC/Oxa1 family membrane protein insertase